MEKLLVYTKNRACVRRWNFICKYLNQTNKQLKLNLLNLSVSYEKDDNKETGLHLKYLDKDGYEGYEMYISRFDMHGRRFEWEYLMQYSENIKKAISPDYISIEILFSDRNHLDQYKKLKFKTKAICKK